MRGGGTKTVLTVGSGPMVKIGMVEGLVGGNVMGNRP